MSAPGATSAEDWEPMVRGIAKAAEAWPTTVAWASSVIGDPARKMDIDAGNRWSEAENFVRELGRERWTRLPDAPHLLLATRLCEDEDAEIRRAGELLRRAFTAAARAARGPLEPEEVWTCDREGEWKDIDPLLRNRRPVLLLVSGTADQDPEQLVSRIRTAGELDVRPEQEVRGAGVPSSEGSFYAEVLRSLTGRLERDVAGALKAALRTCTEDGPVAVVRPTLDMETPDEASVDRLGSFLGTLFPQVVEDAAGDGDLPAIKLVQPVIDRDGGASRLWEAVKDNRGIQVRHVRVASVPGPEDVLRLVGDRGIPAEFVEQYVRRVFDGAPPPRVIFARLVEYEYLLAT